MESRRVPQTPFLSVFTAFCSSDFLRELCYLLWIIWIEAETCRVLSFSIFLRFTFVLYNSQLFC